MTIFNPYLKSRHLRPDPNITWLIAGLGNPGRSYENTRHNAGFRVCDALSKRWECSFSIKKFKAHAAKAVFGEATSFIIKPQTYMNLSGESIKSFMNYFRIGADRALVIYDDMDLPPGTLRLRKSGGSGGHKGMESVISMLGTKNIHRIRVGIGKPDNLFVDGADYVLEKVSRGERALLKLAEEEACLAVETILTAGFEKAMNVFNVKNSS